MCVCVCACVCVCVCVCVCLWCSVYYVYSREKISAPDRDHPPPPNYSERIYATDWINVIKSIYYSILLSECTTGHKFQSLE